MANELDQVSGVEGILDINKRRQQYLDDLELKKQNAQSEFDSYARDTSGEPLDMSRVEQYKDQVEPWRFEQSLYKLQEDHFNARTPEAANANMRFTPVLDKYLLDNPEAFVNLDAKQNRDANLAWADREEAHHYPVFSGDMRGEFKDLNDDDYQVYAVAGYISESSDLGFNDVVDNIDIFASKYAAENNLTSPDVSAVFSHIKGNLTERKTARDTDKANWQNGISSVLNGLSANEALANSVDDKGGKVTTAARSSLMNEFGNELPKAKEFFERFAAGSDKSERFIQKMEGTRDVIGMFEGIFSAVETPKQMKDAVTELVLMPQEQRRKTLALMWMMAEDQAGELEAGVAGKFGESFMRGLDSYVKNIDDAVDSSVEGLARDADLTRAKREMHQDLRDIREVVAEIKSDNKFMQGVYDSARSLPYMMSAAIPYGGLALNAASMATDNDIKLRRMYPDMDEADRWNISLAAGTIQSGIERLSFRTWMKGFPSASRYLAGKGIAGKVGVFGVRAAGIIATENLEESLQSGTLPVMQKIWGSFADDIPEVTEADWEESLFIYNERTFFATLPLALMGAGGKTAYDMIGASQSNEMLSDVDRVMLHGFSEQEAKAIAGESDSMKKWLMFKEGSDAKTKEERKDMSEKAVEDGALDRVLEKDEAQAFEAYERDINENGTEEDKVKLEVQTMSREYSKKYDAQIEQEGEQFKVVFPEGKPTQTYETKEEADSAVQAHHVEVNENYLEALSSASANVQAMALQKTVLEKKQEGAKVEVGVPILGLKEFADKSDANMKQALERIEHELLKTGEVRPATKADLEKWRTRGQVKLKKDARGYVAQLTEGANIADLVEEGSEGFMRDLVDNGMIEEKWVKEQIIRYQEETGNRLTTAESVDQMTYQQMVEAFSDMAVANFYNAHQQDKTGKLGAIINALRIFFAKVAKLAEELMILQKEGKIDADFQTLLDNSVGLNMDDQIARQTEEAQKDILGDATPSMSIGRTTITPTADTKFVEGSNATVVGEASFSIGAWHGTPHKVDKFRTEQIGTGEGAQAYGYGLYFAEAKEVARSYRETLSSSVDAKLKDGTPLPAWVFRGHNDGRGDEIRAEFEDRKANAQKIIESKEGQHWQAHDVIATADRILKALDELDRGEVATQGRLYKVELNVEQEQLLDWDKPLSEQSEMVRTSVAKLADHARGIINESGEVSHLRFVDRMQMEKLEGQYTYLALDILSTRKGLSELFARFGIKGIKYLDGTSRGAGEGTYNYVMFDDADIKITEENGKAVSMDEVESVSMSISPAQDATYMDAVESGDVETQQRMVDEAARKAGYDSPKVYHGTDRKFDTFKVGSRDGKWNAMQNGIWVSPKKGVAKRYAKKDGYIKELYVKMENPLSLRLKREARDWRANRGDGDLLSRGYDSMIISDNEWVLTDPSQIKSADPVTYDADGNVIPLSQRFDAGRDEISMSLAPAGDTVMDKINALMRDPDTRIEIYKDMASRLLKIRDKINKGIGTTDMVAQNISQLEAVMSVLPPEIRYAAGKASKMAKYKTTESALRYLKQRLDRVDTALEGYLRKELRADVSKLIKNSQPKGKQKASDTGQSKLGAVGHRIAEAAKKAVKMSPDEAGLAAQLERAKLDKIEEPTVDEIQEHEDVAYVYEMFADIENADSNRLTMMKRLIQTNWDEGRQQWKAELSKRKAWRESKVGDILTGLNKLFKSQGETNTASEQEAVAKSFARELVSFYQITDMLREDMKAEEGSTVKEMADDFRKASNAFEWEQLQHKEAMKKVFSEIFGIKGANKTARVQARLNALAKGVQWGSRVTISKMYDYKVAANAAELDQAYQQLQADPELDRVDIRDKNISRDEFNQMYIEYQNQIAEGFSPTGRKLFRHTIERNTGDRESVNKMSQLDLLKDWLAVQQLDLKDKYDKTGHDEQYREELDEALDDDVKELGLWMQGKLREMTPETEALHRSEYGLSMATVENYFPAVFEHVGKPETSLAIDGIEIAGVSKRPSAHKMRVNHNSRPKRQNAVNVFNHNIMQDAFWKTHAEVLRKWAGVLRDTDVQDGILRAKGDGFLKHMNRWLENIETQGAAVAQAQIESDRVWRSIGKGMALGVLGLKLSTIMKNLAAGFNVALGVDAKYLIKGLRPELFSEARELLKSETFQRRLKMGATVATRYALQGGKAGNLTFSTSERLAEVGVQGINIADTGSNMTMALAYTAKIRELRKEGVSETDAKDQALDFVDDLMARFAQPTDRLSKSLAENTRMPQAQFLVMFQSEIRKMMAINALAIRKLVYNKGVQSKSLAAQQLIVQVVLVNGFIHVVEALYGAMFRGFGEGDDAEEKFIEDLTDGKKLIANIFADSMSGVPVAGEAWAMAVRYGFDQDVFSSTSNPLVRSMTGSKQLLTVAGKWEEKSASENADTVMRGIQGLAAVAPQTAVLSQVSNFSRDSLGFLNNALKTGLNKEDTFKLYEKRIKKVTSYVHADTKDEMKKAKDEKDRRMIRSIETQRKEEILGRTRDILLEMKEADRKEFLKQQKDSEKGIQKYIINDARSL